jgi:rieske iron-sulfur protein
MSPVRAFAQDAATMPPQPGDYLVRATGDDIAPLTPADIETGARAIQVWPAAADGEIVRDGTLFNLLIVSRWDPAMLGAEAQGYAAEGVVAQSVICTHSACEVTDWAEDLQVLECPCHLSRFDPRFNGAVVQGPATRRLPALALAMEGERIVVARPFDSRVGGDVTE